MTKDMIKRLFPNTRDVDAVVKVIDQYKDKFGLNTDLRLGHFLAQVREEVGSDFRVLRENLNYTSDGLKKTFGKRFTDEDAKRYGRGTNSANQEVIANLAYANRLGNGAPDSDGDGDMDADDDGWKYRGAGCLQITGKSNFEEVQKRCLKYAGKEMDPDTLEGFVVFGMAYWIQHDLYKIADIGTDLSVVDGITAKINKYTSSYDSRRKHFNNISHLIKN